MGLHKVFKQVYLLPLNLMMKIKKAEFDDENNTQDQGFKLSVA